jgi:hypothetical protein
MWLTMSSLTSPHTQVSLRFRGSYRMIFVRVILVTFTFSRHFLFLRCQRTPSSGCLASVATGPHRYGCCGHPRWRPTVRCSPAPSVRPLERPPPDSQACGRVIEVTMSMVACLARKFERGRLVGRRMCRLLARRRCNSLHSVHQNALLQLSSSPFRIAAPHAGAGGARNRAISRGISWNICRGTAIWAI